MEQETIDAEFEIVELPAIDELSNIKWKTKDGEIIRVIDMDDKHLRNCALFLMGFGYQKCVASEPIRVAWLTILRTEWERRENNRQAGLRRWTVR